MFLKRFSGILFSLSLLAVAHCCPAGDLPLAVGQPGGEAVRGVLKRELSTLNIAIEATTDDLARLMNQGVANELYKGSTKTRGLAADVVRNGPIAITAADDCLYVTLPVRLTLNYGMFATRAIPLKLQFKLKPTVTPDWRIHTEISYLGLSDLLAENIGIGPLSFKPRGIVEGITQPLQKLFSELVTQKINKQIPLKAQVAKVWDMAWKPLLLDKRYSAWLTLNPRGVLLSPLYARNNRVRLAVGIETFAELLVGPEPAGHPPQPLPNLKQVNSFDNTFRVALNADLFFSDLRAILTTQLLNKQFDSDGEHIVIKDLDLYAVGDKLAVKLQTQGSLEGVFVVTAKPVFNAQTNVFSVEDVDFDMQTSSLLLQSADWFLHGTIRGMIRDKLNMNLTEQLEQSRRMAERALSGVQLNEQMLLKGSIKELKFKEMVVQQDKISIQLYGEGETAVYFP